MMKNRPCTVQCPCAPCETIRNMSLPARPIPPNSLFAQHCLPIPRSACPRAKAHPAMRTTAPRSPSKKSRPFALGLKATPPAASPPAPSSPMMPSTTLSLPIWRSSRLETPSPSSVTSPSQISPTPLTLAALHASPMPKLPSTVGPRTSSSTASHGAATSSAPCP